MQNKWEESILSLLLLAMVFKVEVLGKIDTLL
jgi:hypothetical protein